MNTLRLDFDGPLPRGVLARIAAATRTVGVTPGAVSYARTRHGWHVTVAIVPSLPPLGVVALQACLGSDPVRELYNLTRALHLDAAPDFWRDRANVLYKRKLA